MKRPSPIYFLLKSEQERVEFLAAGVDLPRGKMMEGREFIRFEIAEDDPRWDSFARVSPRASGPCTEEQNSSRRGEGFPWRECRRV